MQTKNLVKSVIFDIDNTIIDIRKITELYTKEEMTLEDWELLESHYLEAPGISGMLELVRILSRQYFIIFLTARMDKPMVRRNTEIHLRNLFGDMPFKLLMRPLGAEEADFIVKEEIYNNEINGKYDVEFCFDDREDVKNLWQRKGLLTLQVHQI